MIDCYRFEAETMDGFKTVDLPVQIFLSELELKKMYAAQLKFGDGEWQNVSMRLISIVQRDKIVMKNQISGVTCIKTELPEVKLNSPLFNLFSLFFCNLDNIIYIDGGFYKL